ncbi:AraC family transcriptional regulator [Paenibacillus allorhizosphaerae]|uniref:HTH-type transcriptional activator RhaR n=1 Tax=Paenibacillus allorhizosphaerae TaxID=2849866 RepID=A0ABM8VJ99_9BACL|nr:AraC family transcriptional regulator [Paenibacillus allorhizosphaerae]CAG7644546.1 HTH-type transcriptional activator RhaR [Paenibacillus allorhizosphaerae]
MQEQRVFQYDNASRTFHFSYLIRKGLYDQKKSHLHEHSYEIYYLLSGKRNYFIQDRVYAVQKGDLIIINKKELHHTADRGEPGHERLLINAAEPFVRPAIDPGAPALLPFHRGSGVLRLNLEEQSAVETLMLRIMDELKGKQAGYELYAEALLTELLLLIYRWEERYVSQDAPSQDNLQEKITQVARYISTHYKEDITLEKLSDHFFISPYYLCRIFKKLTGLSVVEYVQLARMREAKRLLEETNEKIIDIAEMVGYASVGHFNRVFKKTAFITPLQFRKRMRKQAR